MELYMGIENWIKIKNSLENIELKWMRNNNFL